MKAKARFLWPIALVILAIGIGFGGGYWYAHGPGSVASHLPNLGKAPSYSLTNQLGKRISSKQFLGKVQIVTFLFPYCTEYCPLIAANLVSLAQDLKDAGLFKKVQFVAFNVDPGGSGPKVMAAFLKQYGWNPDDTHWQYLTGRPAEVRQIVSGGFHVDYRRESLAFEASAEAQAKHEGQYVPGPQVVNPLAKKAKPNYDVVHNNALIVVGPKGHIRRVYDEASRLRNTTLMNDIRALIH